MQNLGNWMADALCADFGCEPEIFFDPLRVKDAKSWCALCPVVKQCLQYAISNDLQHGVFGGYTEEERRKLVKDAKRTAARSRLQKGRK